MLRSLGRVLLNSVVLPKGPTFGTSVCQIRKMSRILRFDGLPYRMSSEDFQDWIHELSEKTPEKVHLISNRQGLASGDAYVTFEDKSMAKIVADNCDEKNIGDSNRYVRIYDSDEEELEWQLNRQAIFKGENKMELYCVRMYGLPFRATEYQVALWFQDAEVNCVDISFHFNRQGRKSGDATAYFASEVEAKKAMEKDKHDMNGRYINLTLDSAAGTFNESGNGKKENCIKMSGLPFRASEEEMKDFFLPNAKCVSVKVILNRDGRPSGDAIASFDSPEEVEEAMQRDGEHLGSRYINLSKLQEESSSSGDCFSLKMSGLPFRTREPEIKDWFSTVAECQRVKILKNRENRPSGEAIAEFATKEDALEAMKLNKEYLGERFVVLTALDF